METQTNPAVQSAVQAQNSIVVIAPYWSNGTWVFDDERVGLFREPFVSGVPEIITDLVQSIPNARQGFRLLFSGKPFPGFQAEYRHATGEYGGNWYVTNDGRKGWLCPALFKYFAEAPERIFVRAEPLN